MQTIDKRYKILFNLCAEILHHLLIIAITVHAIVTELDIIFVSKHSCLLGTILHHLIINLVNFTCNLLEISADRSPCAFSRSTILRGHKRPHQRQIVDFSVKRDLCCRNQFSVTTDQSVLFLHQRNQFLIKGL